jgi:hypothetical protein
MCDQILQFSNLIFLIECVLLRDQTDLIAEFCLRDSKIVYPFNCLLIITTCFDHKTGCAIVEAVSRWLPTAAARVWQMGFVVDKVALGQVFSEYFGFSCQNPSFHQLLHPHAQRPCDELITHPRSPANCPRSSDRNETESVLEANKAQNWAIGPQEKKKTLVLIIQLVIIR